MEIVTWVKRRDALAWRREKSAALVELAKATPAKDTPATLMKRPVKLTSGRTFDARKADAEAVRAAAKEERQALAERRGGGRRRGVTTTKSERDRGARLEAALRRAGLKDARVTVVARPRGGCRLADRARPRREPRRAGEGGARRSRGQVNAFTGASERACSTILAIRRANPEDVERLGQLAGQLVRAHHAADPGRFMLVPDVDAGYGRWLGREAKRREAVVLVAVVAGVVVGYAYGALGGRDWNELLDEHGALHDILVDESHRRAGIGGRLLDAMLAELDALGAPRIVLKTMTGNEAAQRLFESRGFRRTMIEMTRGG